MQSGNMHGSTSEPLHMLFLPFPKSFPASSTWPGQYLCLYEVSVEVLLPGGNIPKYLQPHVPHVWGALSPETPLPCAGGLPLYISAGCWLDLTTQSFLLSYS